jgi:predicted sugar kinase
MRGMDSATGMATKLEDLVSTFNKAGISSSYSVIDGRQYGEAVNISMQALGTAFFRPNTILLKYQESQEVEYPSIFNQSLKNDWAVTMYVPNDEVGLGIENTVNVWIKAVPEDWEAQLELGNNDLSLLLGLIVFKNWKKNDKNARLNIIQLVEEGSDLKEKELQLKRIKELARLPQEAEMSILEYDAEGSFWHKGPSADLHIMNYAFTNENFEQMKTISNHLKASCLFTIDSNNENALV